MDPFTLFALANGAVQAVKKGCELYKEIASVAGDVKSVLSDLESQFNSRHKDRAAYYCGKKPIHRRKKPHT
jgi:hypothetical protein